MVMMSKRSLVAVVDVVPAVMYFLLLLVSFLSALIRRERRCSGHIRFACLPVCNRVWASPAHLPTASRATICTAAL